jgi:Mg/Co/Ni transporter MgtE
MSIVTKVLAKEFAAGQSLGGILAVPGFADLHTPVALSSRGGTLPSLEFQVPLGTLQILARVVSGFMGQMGPTPGQ